MVLGPPPLDFDLDEYSEKLKFRKHVKLLIIKELNLSQSTIWSQLSYQTYKGHNVFISFSEDLFGCSNLFVSFSYYIAQQKTQVSNEKFDIQDPNLIYNIKKFLEDSNKNYIKRRNKIKIIKNALKLCVILCCIVLLCYIRH